MLKIRISVPAFTLPDQNGNMRSLADYQGQKVILYFYPKDMTAGCTKQACAQMFEHLPFDLYIKTQFDHDLHAVQFRPEPGDLFPQRGVLSQDGILIVAIRASQVSQSKP